MIADRRHVPILRLMALKPICFASPCESPSTSSQSAGNRMIRRLMASRGAQNELLASDEFVGISAGIPTAIWVRYQRAPDRHRSPQCEAPRAASKAERRCGGLHLLVNPNGARYWRMAYRYQGRQKTLALGIYPTVSLADARMARDAAKKLLACDVDPSQARKKQKRAARLSAESTFEIVAREWCENRKDGWTARYHDHVVTRLEADVFSEIGARPIAEIEPPELLAVLRKVEKRGALEIAKRLRQTVGQVFRYGIVTGRAKRDPAVDLKGALKASGRQAHHKAMPREDLPEFLRALSNYDGEARTRLALRLALLTFVRTTELRAARWDEVDLEAAEWRIPAERMKMRAPHIVPLSRQAVETFAELRSIAGRSVYVFPSPGAEGFMSNNTMLFAMYRMGFHGRATVHGFRSVASTGFRHDPSPLQIGSPSQRLPARRCGRARARR
jgi:integrase